MAGPLSDHVTISISIDSVGVPRAGFGLPLIVSHNAAFAERVRFYSGIAEVAADGFATTSPEYLAASAFLNQNPKPPQIAIGRAGTGPTLAYEISVASVVVDTAYTLKVKGEGVTSTTVTYTTLADITFTTTHASETFTSTAHGMETGDGPYRVSNSGGGLPAGIAVDTDYWIIKLTADTYQLAATRADALAETELLITSDGTGTHTLRRNQNDVIIAQLVQGLNDVVGNNYTAAQVAGAGETDHLTVTGDAAGEWFSLEINSADLLTSAMTHTAGTITTNLDAIANSQPGFYEVHTLYNSPAYVLEVAAWAETNERIYVPDVPETEALTTTVDAGTDTLAQLFDLGYANTMGCYHPAPNQMFGGAWMGRWLPTLPGRATAKFKTLSGVEPVSLSSTHRTNLRARRANTYETTAARNITWEGTVPSTEYRFIDVTRNLHWLEDQVVKSIFETLADADITTMDDDGLAAIYGAVSGPVKGIAVSQTVLRGNPMPVVTVPKLEDIETADKSDRVVRNVGFSGQLAGAIHKVIVNGSVSF